MKKIELMILTILVALSPLTVLAQKNLTRLRSNSKSATAVDDANMMQQNTGRADYQTQINHNDYRIPTISTTDGDNGDSFGRSDRSQVGQNTNPKQYSRSKASP